MLSPMKVMAYMMTYCGIRLARGVQELRHQGAEEQDGLGIAHLGQRSPGHMAAHQFRTLRFGLDVPAFPQGADAQPHQIGRARQPDDLKHQR